MKTRWDKTYWVGWGGNGPHMSNITTEEGDRVMPELFLYKKDALKYFTRVVKVKLVPAGGADK